MRDFEDADELLTALPDQGEEEPSWFMQDSGIGMPYWILILLAVLVILFVLLGCYISKTMSKNKAHRDLQERAIM